MQKLTAKQKTIAKKEAAPYKGVSVDICNVNKPYKSVFYLNGARSYLGYFDNAQDAALAYNKKAKSTYGSIKLAKAANKWNEMTTTTV